MECEFCSGPAFPRCLRCGGCRHCCFWGECGGRSPRRFAAIAAGVVVLLPAPAFAYIDPGAGSLLFQSVVGLVVAALVALRLWRSRLLAAIRAGADSVRIVFRRLRG